MADDPQQSVIKARRPSQFANLPRRLYLTYRYHGLRTVLLRALTFPVRFTPFKHRLGMGVPSTAKARTTAMAWYRLHGQPVTIVIPRYRDADLVAQCVARIRKTVPRNRVRIVVADDASGPEHLAALSQIRGIEVVAGETNVGFSANVNRALIHVGTETDVVLLNSDVLPETGWLACLQYSTSRAHDRGLVGAKLLYPDRRIQYGGTVRNLGALEWFDHRYRFKPADWGPSEIGCPTLAVTGACMYITRQALERVGLLDEGFPMAYEDVDYSLRVWRAGMEVRYEPSAVLVHLESPTRGTDVGERERASQRHFWEKWSDFLDARNVRHPDGRLRVIYVTEGTGVGGGHRDIFEHLNRLLDRGHDVELWTLDDPPDWFELHAPVRTFDNYAQLASELEPIEAIKVATWWNTAHSVWLASIRNGIPVYFVQDIETSYYRDNWTMQQCVLESYRHEFRYMTISSWNRERLRELGLDAALIPPGIDLENFQPLSGVSRAGDRVLALGRTHPLKNFPLTLTAWQSLPEPRPELWLFGIEPELASEDGIRYVESPSDAEVNQLFNEATVFVQTSRHEGFCLPALEAMATGAAVVCTDAHGNRDFCRDGENCLMPGASPEEVSAAIAKLLADPELRAALGAAGIETAADYAWERRIDALESFFTEIATPRRIEPSTDVVPERRTASR